MSKPNASSSDPVLNRPMPPFLPSLATMTDISLVVEHVSDEEERMRAERARLRVPLASHAEISLEGRRDPVEMLLEQERLQGRDESLLALRHGRMVFSPFSFYRGAARIMAHDLARTPESGIRHMWICGDAHLCNFGMFASRERTLVFDINDFDETCVGPFEWDVKRLAASFVIAAANNGFSEEESDYACLEVLRTYRESVHSFMQMTALELFYTQLPVERALDVLNFGEGNSTCCEDQKGKKGREMGTWFVSLSAAHQTAARKRTRRRRRKRRRRRDASSRSSRKAR